MSVLHILLGWCWNWRVSSMRVSWTQLKEIPMNGSHLWKAMNLNEHIIYQWYYYKWGFYDPCSLLEYAQSLGEYSSKSASQSHDVFVDSWFTLGFLFLLIKIGRFMVSTYTFNSAPVFSKPSSATMHSPLMHGFSGIFGYCCLKAFLCYGQDWKSWPSRCTFARTCITTGPIPEVRA